MNTNNPIAFESPTALAFLEMVLLLKQFEQNIFATLSVDQCSIAKENVVAALRNIKSSSRDGEGFVTGILDTLAGYLESAAPKSKHAERRGPTDEPEAESETELFEIFAAIDDPYIMALAKMVALDMLLGSFSDDVCSSLGAKNRQSIKDALEKLKVKAPGAFISPELNVTLYAMETILAGLDAAEEHAKTEINTVDLAATLRFVRTFSHKCRRQSAQKVGRDITEEIKASAASLYKRAYASAGGDKKKYHLAVIFEIKRLAAEIGLYLRSSGVQATAEPADVV